MITALLIGAGAWWLLHRKRNGVSGIGATKRRIYKELSLAQQAGVDFSKPYDELSADEIEALERVSHDTGYTETYYKSLQKAYNAISGIGEAYDVVNADGETVLTWIENPDGTRMQIYRPADDAERYAALREAHDIEDERLWAEKNRAQAFEEREARLAKQRKRLRKSGRTTQMSLFGCGDLNMSDLLEPELVEFVRQNVDSRRMSIAYDEIDRMRCPLSMAEPTLYNNIMDLVEEWCTDNAVDPDSVWEVVDVEDIFWEL